MDNITTALENKVNSIKEAEKKLAILINQQAMEINSLKKVNTNMENKLNVLEHKFDLLEKKCDMNKTYKDFSPEEIVEMKKTMSWSKLANRLHCSVSTVQRLVQIGKEKSHG